MLSIRFDVACSRYIRCTVCADEPHCSFTGLYGHGPMRHTTRTPLTHTLIVLPMLASTQLISACGDSKDATHSKRTQAISTTENDPLAASSKGTVAVSPQALFDFLFVSTRFEFWNCMSSDNTNSFIALNSKGDETDEGFNPLLLLGELREPQLPGDPRALSDDEKDDDTRLQTKPVSFAVTGSDSITITLHVNNNFRSSVNDTAVYLTTVRTGPGRSFTAENQLDKTRILCNADNVGADIMR